MFYFAIPGVCGLQMRSEVQLGNCSFSYRGAPLLTLDSTVEFFFQNIHVRKQRFEPLFRFFRLEERHNDLLSPSVHLLQS